VQREGVAAVNEEVRDDADKTPSRRPVHQIICICLQKLWADADLCWLDQKMDGAVELLATRKSNGNTLAVEHTLLEPFVGNKRDFAQFEPVFPSIKDDQSLVLPERWTRVFIPVGTLDGQSQQAEKHW
jgi:hypothetical protein